MFTATFLKYSSSDISEWSDFDLKCKCRDPSVSRFSFPLASTENSFPYSMYLIFG